MAAVPIEVNGVLYDVLNRTTQRVVLMGSASIMGLTPGGGPIIPPDQLPPGGGGGPPPHPEHPIWGPPGIEFPPGPGYPPGIGGGPIVPPEPPIPPDVPQPAPPNTVLKPAPDDGGWGLYTDADGTVHWAYRPGAGQPGPKR